jgi:hypothetical protein
MPFLMHAAPQPAPKGAVQKLVTDPGGVEVLVDGVLWGSTDAETGVLVLRGLAFGERSFTLRRRGYESVNFTVVYKSEQTGEIFVQMKPLHAAPRLGSLLLEDVLDMLEGDVALERLAVLIRKKGVGLDLASESELRRLAATSGAGRARRIALAQMLAFGSARDMVRGDYAAAISTLEFATRLHPANAAIRGSLQRARRARETELEVLSRP